jgi:nicotinate phosphoribosyltransferase
MRKTYQDISLASYTDAYRVKMVETYWQDNMHFKQALFELFFRNGYGLFIGLESIANNIKEIKFTDNGINNLRGVYGYEW